MKKKGSPKPKQWKPKLKQKKSPYVKDENPQLQVVVRELRALVAGLVPGTEETVNAWGVPTFERAAPFCFYLVGKNHVTFGFHLGTSLADAHQLLEGTGKNVRHVKLRTTEDVKHTGVRELILEAARCQNKSPLRGMSRKGNLA
jgi:hypothetical protein